MSGEPQFRTKPFLYEIDDLRALAGQVQQHLIRRLRIAAFLLLGVVALTIVIDVTIIPGDLDWAPLAAGIIAAILLLLFSNTRFRARIWLKLMQRSAFYAANSFGILPDGLHVSSAKARSVVAWSAIREIRRVNGRTFFFMSKRLAYIVPARAFDSDAEFEAFSGAAEERWKAHHRL
jgi:hypothetical protein